MMYDPWHEYGILRKPKTYMHPKFRKLKKRIAQYQRKYRECQEEKSLIKQRIKIKQMLIKELEKQLKGSRGKHLKNKAKRKVPSNELKIHFSGETKYKKKKQ